MHSYRAAVYAFVAVIGLGLLAASPALGVLSANGSVSTSQSSAPFTYTVTINNTGDQPIGTVWFGWTDTPADYNFLPTSPTVASSPSGWVSPVTHNFPGDGYGIEWYNLGGSNLAPGGSSSAFQFTSNDSPATLAGNAFIPPFKITNTVIYAGFPLSGPNSAFTVSVPEPGTVSLVGIAICAVALKRRGRR
jgi:hypothetical protein